MNTTSIEHPLEYTLTPGAVKRQLRRLKITYREASEQTDQSPALICMVLNRQARSAPCLRKLTQLIRERKGATG